MKRRNLHTLLVLIAAGLMLWVVSMDKKELPSQVVNLKIPGKSALPEVPPVQVPAPKKTSGKKDVGGEKVVSKEVDTNWDKDRDGVVDAGFTGVKRKWRDDAKTILEIEEPYKNGVEHGTCNWYYITGELSQQHDWEKGIYKRHRRYYKNGTLQFDGPKEPGFLRLSIGTESHYSKSGTLTSQILHDGKGGSKVVFDLEKGIDER